MIDREKQLYDWANPKQTIGEGFIHFIKNIDIELKPTPDPQYKLMPVENEYICENHNKYAKQERYLSTDNGQTWLPLNEFSKGELIEDGSNDCN